MKILIAGGTGMIGGHAALYLRDHGHDVTIAGRNPAQPGSALETLPYLALDYTDPDLPAAALRGFDALIFAAGNDIRHLARGASASAHWQRANTEAIPAFFAKARQAGIGRAVQIGSFYPQAMPALVATNQYVASRKAACEGARALSGEDFFVVSLNAPFVVGHVPGLLLPMFKAYTDYALGKLPLPVFAPPGGVNFISTLSLCEATLGALLRGRNGQAYLVGDENLSFATYFGHFFNAVGRPVPETRDAEHPLLPDAALYFGRGNTLHYQPDAAETEILGYRRGDVARAVAELVNAYRSLPS